MTATKARTGSRGRPDVRGVGAKGPKEPRMASSGLSRWPSAAGATMGQGAQEQGRALGRVLFWALPQPSPLLHPADPVCPTVLSTCNVPGPLSPAPATPPPGF